MKAVVVSAPHELPKTGVDSPNVGCEESRETAIGLDGVGANYLQSRAGATIVRIASVICAL